MSELVAVESSVSFVWAPRCYPLEAKLSEKRLTYRRLFGLAALPFFFAGCVAPSVTRTC